MKSITLVGILVLVLLVVGCGQKVVCNKPYILVGSECCLDKDNNGICDKDELKEEPKVEIKEQPTEEKEDKCGNEVCDEGEDCESCQKDCGKCFSLNDLQADINKVIDWKVVLKKEKEDNVANNYIYSELRARLLGKYPAEGAGIKPTEAYNKVLPKRYVLVSQIKDKKDYIKDSDEFYQYILKNNAYILEPIEEAKKNFQDDFKDGELSNRVFGDNAYKYKFVDIDSTEERIFFDNVTQIQTVGNKIVETVFVSTDDYKVTYQEEGIRVPTKKEFAGINYEYVVSVYCSPSLVITLYQWDSYNKQDYTSHLKDNSYFNNDLRHDRKTILVDATALVSMCEQRYEFTYLRYR